MVELGLLGKGVTQSLAEVGLWRKFLELKGEYV